MVIWRKLAAASKLVLSLVSLNFDNLHVVRFTIMIMSRKCCSFISKSDREFLIQLLSAKHSLYSLVRWRGLEWDPSRNCVVDSQQASVHNNSLSTISMAILVFYVVFIPSIYVAKMLMVSLNQLFGPQAIVQNNTGYTLLAVQPSISFIPGYTWIQPHQFHQSLHEHTNMG